MRTMGLDVGSKTIGVAISDEMGWTAQGITTIHRRSQEEDLGAIRQLVDEYQVSHIVVGFPKNMNNTIGPSGELCLQFAELLQKELEIGITMWDERLTTMAAERTLIEADISRKKRKVVIDKLAATLILQSYLDSK
ncbi:Holliday junction resolvase RuvX [Rubeoparvulum massiliense]|uniref:Holliday junction resolvase RuvX n=1 Tax=Rubeoparvulum massiliense TaxID=1631346 RepID=UPI00065E1A8C|nr:Holliday junction resolvase RuvX [Rubeoparvulum massiliense]